MKTNEEILKPFIRRKYPNSTTDKNDSIVDTYNALRAMYELKSELKKELIDYLNKNPHLGSVTIKELTDKINSL